MCHSREARRNVIEHHTIHAEVLVIAKQREHGNLRALNRTHDAVEEPPVVLAVTLEYLVAKQHECSWLRAQNLSDKLTMDCIALTPHFERTGSLLIADHCNGRHAFGNAM